MPQLGTASHPFRTLARDDFVAEIALDSMAGG
jgi:hypothetical protein